MDVLLCEDFHNATSIFDDASQRNPEALATVIGLIAHSREGFCDRKCACCGKNNNCHSQSIKAFPNALAKPLENGAKRSPLSPDRFQRLITCTTIDEFYDQLRRALALIKFAPPIISLADGILQWSEDQRSKDKTNFTKHLRYHWTEAYYAGRLLNKLES
jgi:CRISPR type I-E-associated protein CasB/Cse2